MRLARILLLLPCLATSPACNDAKKADPAPTDAKAAVEAKAAPEPTAGTCDAAHGAVVEKEMLTWCALSDMGISPDVPLAPWKPAPTDRPTDGRIELRPGGLQVGWGRSAKADELVELLAAERETATMVGRTVDGWSLTIGADTPRAEVAAVVKTLSDADQRTGTVVLSVEPTAPVPQPRDPARLAALDAKIGGVDPSQRATLLAKEIEQAMPPCPGMAKAFSAVAMAAPDQRCPLLARGISEGLVGCGCPKEDEMLTLIYGVSLGSKPPERLAVAVPATLDPAATPRPGATWGEIVAGLDEAALQALWVD